MIADQIAELAAVRAAEHGAPPSQHPLPNGGVLIRVPDVPIGPGWNRPSANILFVAPPGYPAAQPDCFWVEPAGLRLEGGGTPQASNDSNPIPGDIEPGRKATWFSWHLQSWDPNAGKLHHYFNTIMRRLQPAR